MSLLTRWSALHQQPGFPLLLREMDSLFGNIENANRNDQAALFTPSSDIVERENAFEVAVDLPGVKPEEIQVKLEGDTLTVSVERRQEKTEEKTSYLRTERSFGLYARSFVMPQSVIGTTPEATYEHGVLKLVLPKREETKPKTVQVKVLNK